MNLAGSCSPKDVESQLLSPGKTTWQKPHAICWKNPYVLEMVQTYRRWVNPCLQGDRCSRGSRLQHSCFLSKIISFSFFYYLLENLVGRDGITAAADAFTPAGHWWWVPGRQKSSHKEGRSKKQKKKKTFKFIAAMLRLSKLCWERLWLAHRNYL